MTSMEKIKIAVTIGDPAGVGPEICCKMIRDYCNKKPDDYELFVVGYKNIIKNTFQNVLKDDFDKYNCVIVEPDEKVNLESIRYGVVNKECGKASMLFVEKATKMVLNGQADALVTSPINKQAINLAGYDFPGHTEYLGYLTNTYDFSMMLVGDKIKVVLVTTHLAIKDIADRIDKKAVKKAILNANSAGRFFGIQKPRIAVCGLNPHAGDGGVLGDEELKIITPVINELKSENIDVHGPFPADSLFPKVLMGEFDFVVCIYHDQGLIPVKMESFGAAVNVTLNLPIIRTSVDHGTAYDIAGKNLANYGSLQRAIEVAKDMVKNVKLNQSL
ncbi:4-hydroxythreonine-4-phosphate dehydrogenase [Deferribacter desulfuricans SSM1]|uniref:4-hydroxythreonine-4-phosphate dehydrogenase n=2 Tax=Deferribacter TaxID=53572 RepID=D3P9D9_DEFDS|nr:4-hydroxythreonine-4-phosphate dehydrogenase [Deferribacter desulfuricans SSM1]